MWSSKDIYYISDSTGILVTNLGQALICQFPEVNFYEEKFPFIRTVAEAKKTMDHIMSQSGGRRPIIFSTILDPEVRAVFDSPEVEYFEAYGLFLERLENCLETRGVREPGFARHPTDVTMNRRVEAIHYCLAHDDGTKVSEYDEADVILLGVSRSGKTPVSVFLATQMGLKSANFPLTAEYLSSYRLPEVIRQNQGRVVALTTSPELLRSAREKRYPGSRYARYATCVEEIKQAEQLYLKSHIPIVSSAGKSIEETATQVMQELGISKKNIL
ncbi:MAG: pyruvate, phosphate dikinase/phosphoenolpyruvate synthase regulator [Deltaproteobacteria bacterium]|jgi:regulator of PEP synthase PpsR (kinase-PPPase family)|nr:pyruvate, phosphate dikinase/phosphoenolpyruvate synthase regulator [Deltaproteobacteria bacterium]